MEINEIKDVALELMDALASKKLGEVAIELEGVKIKIKAAAPAPSSQLRLPRQLLRQHPLHRRQPQQRDRNGAGGRSSKPVRGQESARRHVLFFSLAG